MVYEIPDNITSLQDYFVYTNSVTGNLFFPATIVMLIIIIFISMLGRNKPVIAAFWSTLMGLLTSIIFNAAKIMDARVSIFFIGLFIGACIWLFFGSQGEE